MVPRGSSWASNDAVRKSMRSNRRRDTKPELALRSELHRRGLRYRIDYRLSMADRHPRPDVVFTRMHIAVFVDGCFWHGCPDHGTVPKGANAEYWSEKLERNRRRDALDTESLLAGGWVVIRVWEHEPVAEAADRIEGAFDQAKSDSLLG